MMPLRSTISGPFWCEIHVGPQTCKSSGDLSMPGTPFFAQGLLLKRGESRRLVMPCYHNHQSCTTVHLAVKRGRSITLCIHQSGLPELAPDVSPLKLP
jgi:hypothetical protein